MSSEIVKLSVALVTRNRVDSLARTLMSLRGQSSQPWEVIVSDDSDPGMQGEVERVATFYGCKYLRGPRRGLYANRNFVATNCRGTHIRTMDDDHEFPVGHLAACIRAVEQDTRAVWILGEYGYDDNCCPIPPVCPPQLNASGFGEAPLDPDCCWALADGASILPSTVFDEGHRYCEAFPFGQAYLEFGSRLFHYGYRARLIADTYVLHHRESGLRGDMHVRIETASAVMASIRHSWHYSPNVKNKARAVAKIIINLVSKRSDVRSGTRGGLRAYFASEGVSKQKLKP